MKGEHLARVGSPPVIQADPFSPQRAIEPQPSVTVHSRTPWIRPGTTAATLAHTGKPPGSPRDWVGITSRPSTRTASGSATSLRSSRWASMLGAGRAAAAVQGEDPVGGEQVGAAG